MAILFIRTVIVYFLTLLAIKLMGKRELGELHPFELVVLLIISDMAALSMQSNAVPMAYSVVPILTITLLQIILSLINLDCPPLRKLLCGSPAILIRHGQLVEAELRKQRISINDLQEMARTQGYFDISAISYAILETNGNLSILPQTQKRQIEVGDIMPDTPREQLPRVLITDGLLDEVSLRELGYDRIWLNRRLAEQRINQPEQALIAGINDTGQFYAQKKSPGSGQRGGKLGGKLGGKRK